MKNERYIAVLLMVLGGWAGAAGAEGDMNTTNEAPPNTERATFAGGCFWCFEAIFQTVDGVLSVTPGYTGGQADNPTYHEVCSGRTGHAEAVEIRYDPAKVSYRALLDLFWRAHDPTQLNRQGADMGTQYRSAIFYHNEDQRKAAEATKEALERAQAYASPIVTEIVPAGLFWKAEDYHEDYYRNNPNAGYCTFVIRPKLQKLGLE